MSEEPNRYTCPRCGSRAVYRAQGCQRPRGERYAVGGGGVQAAAEDTHRTFGCRSCENRLPHVYDLREERLAKPLDP